MTRARHVLALAGVVILSGCSPARPGVAYPRPGHDCLAPSVLDTVASSFGEVARIDSAGRVHVVDFLSEELASYDVTLPSAAKQIVATPTEFCALLVSNDVYCWGEPSPHDDRVCAWHSARRARVVLSDVVRIGEFADRFCALGADARTRCWGWNGATGYQGDDGYSCRPVLMEHPSGGARGFLSRRAERCWVTSAGAVNCESSVLVGWPQAGTIVDFPGLRLEQVEEIWMTGDRVCAYGAAERGPGVACCSVGADECRFRSLGSRPTDVLQVGGRVLAISPDGPVVVEDGLPFTDWMPLEWISDGFVGAARECAVYARDRDVRCPGGPSGVVLVDQLGRARFGR